MRVAYSESMHYNTAHEYCTHQPQEQQEQEQPASELLAFYR